MSKLSSPSSISVCFLALVACGTGLLFYLPKSNNPSENTLTTNHNSEASQISTFSHDPIHPDLRFVDCSIDIKSDASNYIQGLFTACTLNQYQIASEYLLKECIASKTINLKKVQEAMELIPSAGKRLKIIGMTVEISKYKNLSDTELKNLSSNVLSLNNLIKTWANSTRDKLINIIQENISVGHSKEWGEYSYFSKKDPQKDLVVKAFTVSLKNISNTSQEDFLSKKEQEIKKTLPQPGGKGIRGPIQKRIDLVLSKIEAVSSSRISQVFTALDDFELTDAQQETFDKLNKELINLKKLQFLSYNIWALSRSKTAENHSNWPAILGSIDSNQIHPMVNRNIQGLTQRKSENIDSQLRSKEIRRMLSIEPISITQF